MTPESSTEPVLTNRASSGLSVLVAVYFRLETMIEAAAESSPQMILVGASFPTITLTLVCPFESYIVVAIALPLLATMDPPVMVTLAAPL